MLASATYNKRLSRTGRKINSSTPSLKWHIAGELINIYLCLAEGSVKAKSQWGSSGRCQRLFCRGASTALVLMRAAGARGEWWKVKWHLQLIEEQTCCSILAQSQRFLLWKPAAWPEGCQGRDDCLDREVSGIRNQMGPWSWFYGADTLADHQPCRPG